MRPNRWITYRYIVAIVLIILGITGAELAASPALDTNQTPPPILINDNEFMPSNWSATAVITGDASFTVGQQLTGGFGSPPFRFMSHRISPTTGLSTIAVTHVYLGAVYDPGIQGAISAIDYSEAGIILSFPFDEAFSTTQPVVIQGGIEYRSPKFLRFIAQNGSHNWEQKTLTQLTAADFFLPGGAENDNPDFSSSGGPIQFGFTRTNSRSNTLPPVPPDQDLIIDQGVDNWRLTVHRESHIEENGPPEAVDDVFILNGNGRSLPLFEIFDVVRNDTDPDLDSLEITEVTSPDHGSAGALSSHTIVYQLDEAVVFDDFTYTVSDGEFSDSALVSVMIDCACTILCLNQLELPRAGADDMIDLPLIYRFRDRVLRKTYDGMRYVDMYYRNNPEILVNIVGNETLRAESVDTLELWQENLRSLTDGDGSALITQVQINALEQFLSHLAAESSANLQQVIANELVRIGPLEEYVGLTMVEAKVRVIGEPRTFAPLIHR